MGPDDTLDQADHPIGPDIAPAPAAATRLGADPTLLRLRRGVGALTTSAVRRMDERLPWYRALRPQDRTWVGLIAQTGITQFVEWYGRPGGRPRFGAEVFEGAPRELTRSISLQQTLDLLLIVVDVIEQQAILHAAPGAQQAVREAVLRYSREVAFAAAEVYARAAETRGAWDARLEAQVVDALVRGEPGEDLHSQAAALGWAETDRAAVLAGTAPTSPIEDTMLLLRRRATSLGLDALVGVQGRRVLVVLGGAGDPLEIAPELAGELGPGPVVTGDVVGSLGEAGHSARTALAGLAAAAARPDVPRPVAAGDLLPERLLSGDPLARAELVRRGYRPLLDTAGGAVLTTVEAYLARGSSIEATARALFVHPNTVRYRLRRGRELTGWDPTDPRDGFVLRTAVAVGRLARDAAP